MSVVIVTYNSARDVDDLVSDLRQHAGTASLRVIVVDNDSHDQTADVVAAHEDVVLVESGGNLGFAGGINRARPYVSPCAAILILNPDLRLRDDAIDTMRATLDRPKVGAVVPLSFVDSNNTLDLTLRFEPSLLGAAGDAVLGGRKFVSRPYWLTETNLRETSYQTPHAVDWATGAAMMIRPEVDRSVGDWSEDYFLYSEETDYCRRIRDNGYLIWYEPSAIVQHTGAGSGTSPALQSLLRVNRVRYVSSHRSRPYAAAYRAIAVFSELIRARDPVHRASLRFLLSRKRWRDLPHATPAPSTG